MPINIVEGDLLKQKTDAIVNTVNCVGVMGKGIALQFKRKWPENYKTYKKACDSQQLKPGKMLVYDLGGLDADKPHFIINFPTKNHWREKSKISYIEDGLEELVNEVNRLNIKSIAVPPLGCGNGGLEWPIVYDLICKAFKKTTAEIFLFPPYGAPEPKTMIVRTEKPNMSIGRAILIKLLSKYREMNYGLSRIEVQKLCYFALESGETVFSKLKYNKQQYGPYADSLRHVLNHMEGHYIQGVGDHDLSKPDIVLLQGALEEAEKLLSQHPETQARIERVADLIEGFETPFGMELLSTVHWVSIKEDKILKSSEEALNKVHSWNDRKKTLFSYEDVKVAWDRLVQQGWVRPADNLA
jgi:O-acetyl-ADP-ribose deacetylase (regulator of RNase III)